MDIDFGFWMIMAGLAGIAGVIALAFHFLRKRPNTVKDPLTKETESFGPGGYCEPLLTTSQELSRSIGGAALGATSRFSPLRYRITIPAPVPVTRTETESGSSDFMTGALIGAVASEIFSSGSDTSSSFDSGSSDSSSGFSGFDSGSSGGGGASSDW